MKRFLIFTFIFLFTLSACGRRGVLEKPEGEGTYPKQYPAPIDYDKSDK